MTKEDNIRAVLETHFTGFREDIIESAVKSVMDITDVQEVRHGHNLNSDTSSLFECSVCHWSCWDTLCGDTTTYNYCPNCGASMRSIDDEVADLPMEAYYNKDWKMDEVTERKCGTCYIAQNYNLEDDDSPCRECEAE